MGRNFLNYDDGDFAYTIPNNMAMDMETDNLHFVSGRSCDEDD